MSKSTATNNDKLQIDLQPRGVFIIRLTDGNSVKGRFSMIALDRFCEKKNIPTYFELISKITISMSISDYAELVVFGIEDYYREDFKQCPWNKVRVMDEIFDIEGFGSDSLMSLFRHAIGRVTAILGNEEEGKKAGEEVEEAEENKKPFTRFDFMTWCAEAGITPNEFWDLCFEEALVVLQGYEARINQQWQQTRVIAYTIACTVTDKDERGDIYDMFPIKGDPTPDERKQAEQRKYNKLLHESKTMVELVREQMKGAK